MSFLDPAGGIRLSMTSITPVRRISKQNQRNSNKPERYSEPEYSSPARLLGSQPLLGRRRGAEWEEGEKKDLLV